MIYFIGGLKNREFKYFEIIENIRKNNSGIQESFFDVDIKEEEKFLEKVSFNSIFSSQELIVLKRAEKVKEIEKLLDYVCNLDISNKEIIIDYGKEDGSGKEPGKLGVKLTKKLEKLKSEKKLEVFLFASSDDSSIKKYIQNELKIDSKDADSLLEMIGNNPFKVKNEVEKIKIFLNGDEFRWEDVKKIISVEKDFELYEMVGHILSNNSKIVLDYLEKTKEYMGILYSLYGELEVMYKISSLSKEGMSFSTNYNVFKKQFEDIKGVFKTGERPPHPYAIFMKIGKIKFYSNKSLKRLLYRCWEIEKDIKIGKIEMEAGVENLILEINSLYNKR